MSGLSDTNVKWPLLSVRVDDDSEGLTTETRAPTIGVVVPATTTTPLRPPVVPASAPIGPSTMQAASTEQSGTRTVIVRSSGGAEAAFSSRSASR